MLKNCLGSLHEKQATAMRAGVVAALKSGLLSLSRLAQRVPCEAALRHRVKRMKPHAPGKTTHRCNAKSFQKMLKIT
jgi:hypothetical protein